MSVLVDEAESSVKIAPQQVARTYLHVRRCMHTYAKGLESRTSLSIRHTVNDMLA